MPISVRGKLVLVLLVPIPRDDSVAFEVFFKRDQILAAAPSLKSCVLGRHYRFLANQNDGTKIHLPREQKHLDYSFLRRAA